MKLLKLVYKIFVLNKNYVVLNRILSESLEVNTEVLKHFSVQILNFSLELVL